MHQTKKGNQWYFGMKLRIGVDSKTKRVHSAVATDAIVHDSQVPGELLHGDEIQVLEDTAYAGQQAALKEVAPRARDLTQHKASRHLALSLQERSRNRTKSRIRSRVEYVFHVLICRSGFTKVRYRGLVHRGCSAQKRRSKPALQWPVLHGATRNLYAAMQNSICSEVP